MTEPLTLLFVDSNVLLHYRGLGEIDWRALAAAHGIEPQVLRVVVAAVIVREIDEQKFANKSGKIRKRAQRLSLELEQAALAAEAGTPQKVRGGVPLIVQVRDSRSAFDTHDLRPRVADDELLAAMLGHQPTATVLVSADAGARMGARRYGLRAIAPDESDRLPGEEDELSKLQRELATLKNKEPKLRLRFSKSTSESGNDVLVVSIPDAPPAPVEAWHTAMAGANALVPPFTGPGASREVSPAEQKSWRDELRRATGANGIDISGLAGSLNGIDARDIARYEADRIRFLRDYESLLRAAFDRWVEYRRSVLLQLELVNDGTVPAEDVSVHIDIPDGPEVQLANAFDDEHPFDTRDVEPSIPAPPEPPVQPRTVLQTMIDQTAMVSVLVPTFPAMLGESVSTGMQLRRTNSFDADQDFPTLQHGYCLDLDVLRLWYPPTVVPTGFSINYRISAANLPSPTTGKLHVRVLGNLPPEVGES
jgi:hypothetical protein